MIFCFGINSIQVIYLPANLKVSTNKPLPCAKTWEKSILYHRPERLADNPVRRA